MYHGNVQRQPPTFTFYTIRFWRHSQHNIKATTARSNYGQIMMLHKYTSEQLSLSSINLLYLTDSMIQPRQHCEGQGHYSKVKGQIKVTPGCCRSKVKSRSHQDVAHLHPQPMFLPSINFLHLMVSEIQPRQTFSHHPTGHPHIH